MTDPLKGRRIFLAPLEEEDLPTLKAWREDGAFLRMLDAAPAHPGLPRELAELVDGPRTGSAFPFSLRRLDDRRMVGFASLDGILWSQGSCWLTLAIGRAQDRGQGYGREALELLLYFAFDELNLRRVSLTVFSYNAPAVRLYESIGFVREGAFREFLQRDGGVHDMVLYGLLRREWQKARKAQDEA